jgi:GT2 family glycosyltransferase
VINAPDRAAVAVTVLNWKSAADTVACIESLLGLEQETGIFVCDNASPDDSMVRLRAWAEERLPAINAGRVAAGRPAVRFRDGERGDPPFGDTARAGSIVTLIQTGANGGYAAGNNVGLRAALAEGYDYFWVLNNDTEVEPDAVTRLLERMRADPAIGICGSTLVYFDRRDLVQNLGGADFDRLKGRGVALGFQTPSAAPVDGPAIEARLKYVSGAAAMVSRAFLERVGLMEEDYFLYWEEFDWAMRARGRFRLGFAPRSVVYHKVGASIGTGDFGEQSPLADYYLARNRLRVGWRFNRIGLPFSALDIARKSIRWLARGNLYRAGVLARALVGLPYRPPRR